MWYVPNIFVPGPGFGPYTVEQLREMMQRNGLSAETVVVDPQGHRSSLGMVCQLWTVGDVVKAVAVGAAVVAAVAFLVEVAESMSSTTEQNAIRSSARGHAWAGADVMADHVRGYPRPPVLECRRRPDVVAVYPDRVVVEEHETWASVNRRHSIDQDRDLRKWARGRKGIRYRQIVT